MTLNDKTKSKTFDKLSDPTENSAKVEAMEIMEVQTFIKAFQELLQESDGGDFTVDNPLTEISVDAKEITVKPGFCVKTLDDVGKKVFLNICHCDDITAPPEINEEELRTLLMSEDESAYRVPMSLGTVHEEADKSGKTCFAYDVVINSGFYEKTNTSEFFKYCIVFIAMEGVEIKYSCKLNRDYVKCLKNKHYYGKMQRHFIRSKPKPLITEMDDKQHSSVTGAGLGEKKAEAEAPLLRAKETKYTKKSVEKSVIEGKKANFVIKKEAANFEFPAKIVIKFNLDGHRDSSKLNLDVGEDRVVLEDTLGLYSKTDFFLPYNVDQNQCQARFDQSDSVLTLSLVCSS